MTLYVRVAVPVPVHDLFTYAVPPSMTLAPGMRVRVPIGARRLVGIVADPPSDAPDVGLTVSRIKPVEAVLDEAPVLTPVVLGLARWIAEYYHVPPGVAYALGLPPEMSGGRTGKTRDHQFKEEILVRLVEGVRPTRLGARMERVWLWLRTVGDATAEAIKAETGAGRDVLNRLERKGVVTFERRRVHRDPFRRFPVASDEAPPLTSQQTAAVTAIGASLGSFSGHLLHGVTGSGKTEVYLALIAQVLAAGKGALVLVPEIALTPQLVGRFRARLGACIAVLHSGLGPAERHEQWLRIAAGELPVVIGARSAVFAPLPAPGIIVVDEEHDGSFKQDTAPPYHARDLALVRGRHEGCPVVLGSATPSLESWANVSRGKLTRVLLSERVSARPMPQVELLDLRDATTVDPERIFSRRLLDAISETVSREEQTILLVNRRGFASFLLCRACGGALECANCSVTMTWHRQRHRLECHYCDRAASRPAACPFCQEDTLQEVGFGTEQVLEVLEGLLPNVRCARMDRDTTRGQALPRLLNAFRRREIDVLVGTQMVAKGHDFPGVTLVGVLLAEQGLRMPDFRAGERTFQLLTQIAGRAGRADLPGRVLVQTYLPDHPVLGHARQHDATGFLDREARDRTHRGFPPHTHLALYRLSGRERAAVARAGEGLRRALQGCQSALGASAAHVYVGCAQPAVIERIKGRWRFQLLVNAPTRGALHRLLEDAERTLREAKWPSTVKRTLDVDPHALL